MNIDQCFCIRQIPRLSEFGYLHQIKQHIGGDVVASDRHEVKVWEAANDLGNTPIKQFNVCDGYSIELLSEDLLLRGGLSGQLEFIDYTNRLPVAIRLYLKYIYAIQRIAKNIVVTTWISQGN